MKKLLVLLLSIILVVSLGLLVACDDDTTTPTPANSSTPAGSSTPAATSAPATESDVQTEPTTPAETTSEPPVTNPVGPNMRDPAKEYHQESVKVKTNSFDNDSEEFYAENHGYLFWPAEANQNERFADRDNMIMYEFDVTGLIEPTITLDVRQNYVIRVFEDQNADESEWHLIANFRDHYDDDIYVPGDFDQNGVYTEGFKNRTSIEIKPYDYEYYGVFYVVITNCNPDYGNGGTIMSFTVSWYEEGKGSEVVDDTPGVPQYHNPETMTQENTVIETNGKDLDKEYLLDGYNFGAATDTRRYFDNDKFGIYRIDLRKFVEPQIILDVTQNYKVEISGDMQTWIPIESYSDTEEYKQLLAEHGSDTAWFKPSGDYIGEENFHHNVVIDPYEHGFYTYLYIRLSDCFPSDAWGAAIEHLTICAWVEKE